MKKLIISTLLFSSSVIADGNSWVNGKNTSYWRFINNTANVLLCEGVLIGTDVQRNKHRTWFTVKVPRGRDAMISVSSARQHKMIISDHDVTCKKA